MIQLQQLRLRTRLSAFFIASAAIMACVFTTYYGTFGQVGWPNIGPAAAGPAGPVPMAPKGNMNTYCISYVYRQSRLLT